MCTVSYLPLPQGGFVITSNRDELVSRSARMPAGHQHTGRLITYPQDPVSEGTWIAAIPQQVVCLLNGGLRTHTKKPAYRHSRGLVPLHFFEFKNAAEFVNNYNFSDLEPFTLICANTEGLYEIINDESGVFFHTHPAGTALIRASSTLYTREVIAQKKAGFDAWLLDKTHHTAEALRHFHQFYHSDDKLNGNVIDRGILKTVSITSVAINNRTGTQMTHSDLLTGTEQGVDVLP